MALTTLSLVEITFLMALTQLFLSSRKADYMNVDHQGLKLVYHYPMK